jgi:zinc transport system substrate-binding protein
MKHSMRIVVHCIFLLCMAWPYVSDGAEMKRPVVVASTTMIGALLQDIGGDSFDILTLIPPTSCPGHFDLKPNDIQKIRKAELIICHPYQKDLQKVLRQYIQDEKKWFVLREEHSLAIPKYYVEAGWLIMNTLSLHFPEKSPFLKNQWDRQREKLMDLERGYRLSFKKGRAQQSPVIVAYRQKELVESWGFRVTGVFDTLEGDTMQHIIGLIQKGRQNAVRAVIGNLQNGDRQAKVLSEKIGVPFIILSNFPGGEGKGVSYEALLKTNCSKLLGILR